MRIELSHWNKVELPSIGRRRRRSDGGENSPSSALPLRQESLSSNKQPEVVKNGETDERDKTRQHKEAHRANGFTRSTSLSTMIPLAFSSVATTTTTVSKNTESRPTKKARKETMNSNKRDKERQPRLVLTTEQHIVVIGSKERGPLDDDDDDRGDLYDEIKSLRCEGRSTAPFLSNSETADQAGSGVNSVSAVMDLTNGCMYALQKGNLRVIGWRLTAYEPTIATSKSAPSGMDLGGDSPHHPLFSVKLPSPAMSLSFLEMYNGRYIFGTMKDGRLFLVNTARENSDENRLNVYGSKGDEKDSVSLMHLATTSFNSTASQQTSHPSGKRPLESGPQSEGACFYQVFFDGRKQSLVLKRIVVHKVEKLEQDFCETLLVPLDTLSSRNEIESAALIGFCDEDQSSVLLRLRMKGDQNSLRVIKLSLSVGDLVCEPFYIHPESNDAVLIGSDTIAAASNSKIRFYEARHGRLVDQRSLEQVSTAFDEAVQNDFSRSTRFSRIVGTQDGLLGMIVTKAKNSGADKDYLILVKVDVGARAMRLADGLKSSLLLKAWHQPSNLRCGQIPKDMRTDDRVQARIDRSTMAFETAVSYARDSDAENIEDQFLLSSFRKAALQITETEVASSSQSKRSPNAKSVEQMNVADELENQPRANGKKAHPSLGKEAGKGRNGFVDDLPSPAASSLPQMNAQAEDLSDVNIKNLPFFFVNQAAASIAKLLTSLPAGSKAGVRREAGLILKHIIKSGAASARLIFQSNTSSNSMMKLLGSFEEKGTYLATQLLVEAFMSCLDLSERQKITALHWMLTRASSVDIAKIATARNRLPWHESKDSLARKSLRLLSLKNAARLTESESEDFKSLSAHLLLEGLRMFLNMVLDYSTCNSSLLCSAMHDILSPDELLVISRLIPGCLHGSLVRSMGGREMRLQIFMSCIIDSIRLDGGASTQSETEIIANLGEIVLKQTNFVGSLLSLKPAALAHAAAEERRINKEELFAQSEMNDQGHGGPPEPYQIERLIFS